jgi:hypothetical protein
MPGGTIAPVTAPASTSRPPGRVVLRVAAALTQLLCAGCLLLGTIAFVLVQQNALPGAGLVIAWAGGALIGLVFGGLMARGGLIILVISAALDAAFGIVLLAIEYDTLRAMLKVLPASDVDAIADVITGIGAALLAACALCVIAIPQALRYTRWMHAETEPRLASSTARGFPPPPVPAAPRSSVWRLPIVGRDESRSRRRMYFALAGFALGFGAGIGVLVSSSSQRSAGGGAASAPAPAASVPAASAPAAAIPAAPVAQPGAGDARPNAEPAAAPAAPAASVQDLIDAQRAAIAKGDLAALARTLAPGGFGFGVDADEVAEGRAAALVQLRKDLGELVRGGATVDVRFSNAGEASEHAWIALDLDVAAPGQEARRLAVSELAARSGGAWTIVAWHWATPVLDKAAERAVLLGTKPSPRPIASVLTGPKDLEAAVRAAFGSRRAFAAAQSEHERAFNFGSGPSERTVGGEAIKRVFGHLKAELRLHDGVRVVAASAWDPSRQAEPAVAFAAANVDFKTRTRAATDLTHTFRVLAILLREEGGWKIDHTHWSPGAPSRCAARRGCGRGSARERGQLGRREEERDLLARRLGRVGAVDRVALDVGRELLADRAGGGLLRVRRAHHLAVLRDRVLALEHLHHDRALGHELHEVAVERPLLVDGVERLRLRLGEPDHLRRHDAQPGRLELGGDRADHVPGDGVGLDDREGAFDGHGSKLLEPSRSGEAVAEDRARLMIEVRGTLVEAAAPRNR